MRDGIDSNTMKAICKNGTYYNPAWKHYNMETNVVCDKCFRDNLVMCIGYKEYDLCLNCVQDISTISKQDTKSYMIQTQFRPGCIKKQMTTNMLQNQFTTMRVTSMLQNQFRPSNDINFDELFKNIK